MKKIILCLLTSITAFAFIPTDVNATTCPIKTELTNDPGISKISLINRLNEIKTMDKSTLTNSEKKELRKEVRSIDKTLKLGPEIIYISAGGLLLILLILILILIL